MFGAPGSGKGTHGRALGAIPNFFHCACGDVFRSLRHDTPLGQTFLEYSSHGKLVPDEPTVELWRKFIDASTQMGRFHPGADTLVLDGIPRSVRQAEVYANLDVIRERLKTYEKETRPVLDFYGKNLVHRINTDGPPVETFFKILKRVVKL